jgi:hypothetical protein
MPSEWTAARMAALALAANWLIDNWQTNSLDDGPPRDPTVERKELEIGGFWYRVGCPDGTWRIPPPEFQPLAEQVYRLSE